MVTHDLVALHRLGRLAHCLLMLAAEMDHLIGTLKDAGLCKDVHYKELYIPQAELEGACAGYIDHMYKTSICCAGGYPAMMHLFQLF